jgi:hypothetical protein
MIGAALMIAAKITQNTVPKGVLVRFGPGAPSSHEPKAAQNWTLDHV